MSSQSKINVLVVLATGKMGTGVTDAFLASGRYNVFGTSRDTGNSRLKAKGVTPVGFEFGSKQSMIDAIKASQAKIVFVNTDFEHVAQLSGERETEQGVAMIDACEELGVEHVVYCSVLLADSAPLQEFNSKHRIEQHLSQSSLSYTILRPAHFFSNFDDATHYNALTRGKIRYIVAPKVKVSFVATYDVGVAAVKVSEDRLHWAGKTLNCSAGNYTMKECAQALTTVSGVKCKYSLSLPVSMQWLLLRDVYNLSAYCNTGKCQVDPEPFRRLIGENVRGPEEYFAHLGQWANGDKFGEVPVKSGCAIM